MTETQTANETGAAAMPVSNVLDADTMAEVDIATLRPVDYGQRLITLDPNEIVVNEGMNMRRFLPDAKGIDELAQDIVRSGQLQPVLVRKTENGKHDLVFGFRRVRAILYANDNKLYKTKQKEPLKVLAMLAPDMSTLESFAANMSENLKRQDLSPVDYGHICKTFVENGLKKSDVARLMKRAPSWVTEHMALTELKPSIQKKVHAGAIPYTAVREILDMPEEEQEQHIKDLESGKTTREGMRKKKSKKKVQGENSGKAALTWKEARQGFMEMSGAELEEGKESKFSARCQEIAGALIKFMDGRMGVKALASRIDEAK